MEEDDDFFAFLMQEQEPYEPGTINVDETSNLVVDNEVMDFGDFEDDWVPAVPQIDPDIIEEDGWEEMGDNQIPLQYIYEIVDSGDETDSEEEDVDSDSDDYL